MLNDISLKFKTISTIAEICTENNISSDKYLKESYASHLIDDITFICKNMPHRTFKENIKRCIDFIDQYGVQSFLSKNKLPHERGDEMPT